MNEIEILYDKEITCPICNIDFTIKRIRNSKLKLVKRDDDFLNYYSIGNPIKYNVVACSNCGYASHQNSFEDISERNVRRLKESVLSKWEKKGRNFEGLRDIDKAIEIYKLTLINYKITKKKKLETGNLLINIAWLYRFKGDQAEENRFLGAARENFIEAYNNESLSGSNMDESKLSYLIGELSRMLKNKEDAIFWYNTCIRLPSTRMNVTIDRMVRDKWDLIKEIK